MIIRACTVLSTHALSGPFATVVHFKCSRLVIAMDFCGKGVFVTGGSRGIGRAIVEALLARGAKVLFCSVNDESGRKTERELQTQYGADNVTFKQCDVADAKALQATFEAAVSKFGAVEICINNAAILNEQMMERTIDVNLVAVIRGSMMALEHMRKDKGGRGGVIINVASDAGFLPVFWGPVYGATKSALLAFTVNWATNPKMAEWGVKWRCFCPTATDTDILRNIPDGAVIGRETFNAVVQARMTSLDHCVKAFLAMMDGMDKVDVIYAVRTDDIGSYVRRQIVDNDGVSNLITADEPNSSA